MKRAIRLMLIVTTILMLGVDGVALFLSAVGLLLCTGCGLADVAIPIIIPLGVGSVVVIGYWVLFVKGWSRAALLVALGAWALAWVSLSLFGVVKSPVDVLLDTVGTIQDAISFGVIRPSNSTSRSLEISENPNVLLDASIPVTDLKLFGVMLSDSPEKLPQPCLTNSYDYGNIFDCGNGIRFITRDSRIQTFELSYTDGGIVQQLGIHSESTVRQRLGSNARVDPSSGRDFVDYELPGRQVTWNVHKHLIAEIDIFAP
jgi:hypothetical protein